MPAKGGRQFGKPSPWAHRGLPERDSRAARLRALHPIIASEDSDDSGGGAPLWTPVSAEFSDTATTTAAVESGLRESLRQSEQAASEVIADREQHEQHQTMASTTAPEQEEHASPVMEQERAPIRHRHTLGSSLSALTAPFVPGSTFNTSQDEPIAITYQNDVACPGAAKENGSWASNTVNGYPQQENMVNGGHNQALVVHGSRLGQITEHRLRVFATPSEETRRTRSDVFNWLTSRGVPFEKDLLDPNYMPFMETTCQHRPVDYAVVQVANIPYGVSRTEISNLMGRNCRRIADNLEGIHIIMTRIDGKTHDAYVEFENLTAAMNVVNRLEARGKNNGIGANSNSSIIRSARLGDRQVSVSLSSQGALMKALFPNARGVNWDGVRPQFPAQASDDPAAHFKGFMTVEELSMLVKHVEFPQRASFSTNCPERPYESFISVLKKFPWNEAHCITIHMQHVMYDTARRLLEFLQDRIERGDLATSSRLTPLLMKRFVATCLLCPGFTVLQKDNILVTAGMVLAEFPNLPLTQPRFADCWRHLYALSPAPGVPQDVLEFYIGIIREETCSMIQYLPAEDNRRLVSKGATTTDYWGYFWLEVSFPRAAEDSSHHGPAQTGASTFDRLTLAEAARLEWSAIDRILRRALLPVSPYQQQNMVQ
ncbi:hypothetical protein Micbo1qcDRAFT_206363 [Microdochium bolleyi]|uniref:RRM domain-containing protein n=1 Tax=Microdochium bolleyi TaxID=196109 RepID=A0A136IWX0_9PEZI|nr:hypothetical protein Micbo1qcDRAFT_206363 [Microdochium bolleyi]